MRGSSGQSFVDHRLVRRNYARVAASYASADFLAGEVDRRMLERLEYVRIEPRAVLDLGCGAGRSLTALRERYREAMLVGADHCPPMLAAGRAERSRLGWLLPFLKPRSAALVAADAVALPFPAAHFGLVWSNLMLHWCDDPRPVFAEVHRVLETGGLLMFSTFGPDTLRELRAAFGDGDAHTQRFTDMHDLGDMLVEAGFSDPVMDMETVTLTYPSFSALIEELRASGGRNAMRARRRGLLGRAAWRQVGARLAANGDAEGRFPVTVEVVYGHAWRAAPRQTGDGRAIIRFERKPA